MFLKVNLKMVFI